MENDPAISEEQADNPKDAFGGLFRFAGNALNVIGPIKNEFLKIIGVVAIMGLVVVFMLPEQDRIWGMCVICAIVIAGFACYTYMTVKGFVSIRQAQLQAQSRKLQKRIRPRNKKGCYAGG